MIPQHPTWQGVSCRQCFLVIVITCATAIGTGVHYDWSSGKITDDPQVFTANDYSYQRCTGAADHMGLY